MSSLTYVYLSIPILPHYHLIYLIITSPTPHQTALEIASRRLQKQIEKTEKKSQPQTQMHNGRATTTATSTGGVGGSGSSETRRLEGKSTQLAKERVDRDSLKSNSGKSDKDELADEALPTVRSQCVEGNAASLLY